MQGFNRLSRRNSAKTNLKAIDVFSGCGGLSLGLRQAGFEVIGAIENNAQASKIYRSNHTGTLLFEQDIRTVTSSYLSRKLRIRPGDLDLLAGCPPCQGFSRITRKNKRRPALDPRNSLIDDFARLALELRPKTIMLENVPHLENYSRFKHFRASLIEAGYCVKTKVLDASDYSVPQRRKRLVLAAAQAQSFEFEEPSFERITVSDVLRNLPLPGQSEDRLHNLGENRTARVAALIKLIPSDGGTRTALPDSMTLDCHKKSNGFSDVYGRMWWDKQSPTITSGCCNPSKGRFLHPEQDRAITLREASLLQGFPADYAFDINVGKEALALMIGNAIPPPMVAYHAASLARQIL